MFRAGCFRQLRILTLVVLREASFKRNTLGVLVVGLVRHVWPGEQKTAATWNDGNGFATKGSYGILPNRYELLRPRLLLATVRGYSLTLH